MPTENDTLSQGWELQQSGRLQEAEQLYRQVLAANPSSANAWCYLGMACNDQQRYEEAVAAYHRALKLQPEFPITYNNLGNTFRMMRRLDDAVAAFDKAIAQKPDYLIAFKNKATTLCWEGRVADALRVYEQAVEFAPDSADVHKHLGIMRLLLGDFAGGWPEYEWRWKTGEIKLPKLDIPRWDGSSLEGKSILLTPEQGLGDTIQFIRYAAWLKERYRCRIVFHCPKPLRQLLSSCAGIDEWIETTQKLPAIDWFAPLLDIPSVFQQTTADFPATIPYIGADNSLVEQWRDKLARFSGRKIGIVWRGSPTHQADVMRSIPLTEFAPLGRLKGVQLFSLQKGKPAEELNTLAARLDIVDLGRELDEKSGAFVESAAVLKNLDLLITCDTAIAHVAGALGVPVWLALCNVPDWRWLASGERTAWYPTMRLFRQTDGGDWASVMRHMESALLEDFPDLQRKEFRDYTLATSGFNRLTRTQHGLMLYNRHDKYIGRSIERYGEFSAGESDLFRQVVQSGWTVVEAGANIGAHTLCLSRIVGPRGAVFAFEPQRLLFQTLCANMALNSISNVLCRCEAVGETAGTIKVPAISYNEEENFGGLSLGGKSGESVPVITIDSMRLPRCQFFKVDVEGMELDVLKGAAQTIEKCRPILYVENDRDQHSPALISFLQSLGYQLYWHMPAMFSPNNFYQNKVNEFDRTVSINMLGIHASVASNINGLRKIEGPDSNWRRP